MKLKTKLIPLAAITATASIVTPLVTLSACNKEVTHSFDLVNNKFEYDKGLSKIKPATIMSATTDYVSAITQNPQMFVYDYVNYLYLMNVSAIENEYCTKLNVSITEPVIGKTVVLYPGEASQTYPTISFKIRLESQYELETPSGTKTTDYLVGEMKYQNVPFFAYNTLWTQWITEEEAEELDPTWSIGILGLVDKFSYIFNYMEDPWRISGWIDTKQTITNEEAEGYESVYTEHYTTSVATASELKHQFGDEDFDSPFRYFLMDFESTYLSEVEVLSEIESSADDLTIQIKKADTGNEVTIAGLYSTTKWSGSFNYEINQKIEQQLYWGDNEFEDTTLVIEKGAQLVLGKVQADGTQSITIQSGTNGKVYIEGLQTSAKKVEDSCMYIWPKHISIVNTNTKVTETIATNSEYITGTVAGTITAPVVKDITMPVSWSTNNGWQFAFDGDTSKISNVVGAGTWTLTPATGEPYEAHVDEFDVTGLGTTLYVAPKTILNSNDQSVTIEGGEKLTANDDATITFYYTDEDGNETEVGTLPLTGFQVNFTAE